MLDQSADKKFLDVESVLNNDAIKDFESLITSQNFSYSNFVKYCSLYGLEDVPQSAPSDNMVRLQIITKLHEKIRTELLLSCENKVPYPEITFEKLPLLVKYRDSETGKIYCFNLIQLCYEFYKPNPINPYTNRQFAPALRNILIQKVDTLIQIFTSLPITTGTVFMNLENEKTKAILGYNEIKAKMTTPRASNKIQSGQLLFFQTWTPRLLATVSSYYLTGYLVYVLRLPITYIITLYLSNSYRIYEILSNQVYGEFSQTQNLEKKVRSNAEPIAVVSTFILAYILSMYLIQLAYYTAKRNLKKLKQATKKKIKNLVS